MGNVDSRAKFKHGHIYLQLNQPYAVSGDNMTGSIYLQLEQPYPAVSMDIELKGKEKCTWTETRTRTVDDGDGKSHTETYTVTFYGAKKILHQRFTIYVFENQVALPGQYTFPFVVSIPNGCPSSAFFTGSDSAVASIKYSVKAILQPNVSVKIQEMKFKQIMIVREMPSYVEENLFSSVVMDINSCC